MRINNNMMAMNTHRQLSISNDAGSKSMGRLSSGFRINRAGDDAAGLSISEKMRGQIRGLNQASRNAQDGISLIQTAEGALQETQAILQRMRELAVQSSSDTNVNELDRESINNEFTQLRGEINRIADNTEFNTQKLLNVGGDGFKATFQIGANAGQIMEITINDMQANALGLTDAANLASGENSRNAITTINTAINTVSTQRSELGAFQNRLEHTIKNLDNSAENLQAAESRIRDVDMAQEMMEFTKQNILQQAATAMLAQANQAPQAVLQLLR